MVDLVRAVVAGAINWDITLHISTFPRKGEQKLVRGVTRAPGGKAGNTAVAIAKLLGREQSAIIGAVGKDSLGSEHVRIFKEEGVDVTGLKFSEDAESGQAYAIVDEKGDNVIYSYRGANETLRPEELDEPERRQLISEASIIAIMNPPYEIALKLAENAKRSQKTVAWDPGLKSESGAVKTRELLENVDYLIANQFEIENLTGIRDYNKAAARLIRINPKLKVVAKLGSKGCVMYYDKERVASRALDLKSRGLKVVSTVGCGDAFLGAFVAALSEGRSEPEALRWGNCAGGLKALRVEARGSPDRETLLKYLA
jgi:ribokinase